MKKILILLIVVCGLWTVDYGLTNAQDTDTSSEEAQEKAAEIHKIAESDAIYVQDEIKALYYQNIQIIDLLQQIRDLMQQQVEQAKGKETEEKS